MTVNDIVEQLIPPGTEVPRLSIMTANAIQNLYHDKGFKPDLIADFRYLAQEDFLRLKGVSYKTLAYFKARLAEHGVKLRTRLELTMERKIAEEADLRVELIKRGKLPGPCEYKHEVASDGRHRIAVTNNRGTRTGEWVTYKAIARLDISGRGMPGFGRKPFTHSYFAVTEYYEGTFPVGQVLRMLMRTRTHRPV